MTEAVPRGSVLEVFRAFLRLGCTSFGGPVAHLGYFRAELVERRGWLDEAGYADIVALCQFLPGPASSQTAVTIGVVRAGLAGGLAAWLGFTLPSAVLMLAFAQGVSLAGEVAHAIWLHGLKLVAVAVVAQAVWNMGRTLCPDRLRVSMAVVAAVVVLMIPSAIGQVGAIVTGGVLGWQLLPGPVAPVQGHLAIGVPRGLAVAALAGFVVLLVGLPLLAGATGVHAVALFDRFYRAGALVFGGGHVVLPLLQQSVVPPGWISNDGFLAGYGAAQAMPGPLFSFAAYLGAAMRPSPAGIAGGLFCLVAIYLPSMLLLLGTLPFWDGLRRRAGVQAALRGVNATVVGLLLAALYTPVWTSAVAAPMDFGLTLLAFLALVFWQVPPWLVVVLGGLAAAALG
ncbi:Chromate efflux transporter [Rhodovastum atsumiense]|uniref:Chromate efflux transporter n=1 Tax=Rhodovastum atsumiense TaxID=504468 RepID=A0A5M6J086_9PROT|nr:chromate efflux transporter [Rhodovastum atsumiense]KAA5613045.1 chromate efflux transporter [Rhodovastum atsumiense]CAH2600098.1 Chromate efflux transporter [Rhodovastum atsumiense]